MNSRGDPEIVYVLLFSVKNTCEFLIIFCKTINADGGHSL